jgi:hypothetical protein
LIDFAQKRLEAVAFGRFINGIAHAEIQCVWLPFPFIEAAQAFPDPIDCSLNDLRIIAVEYDAEFVAAVACDEIGKCECFAKIRTASISAASPSVWRNGH